MEFTDHIFQKLCERYSIRSISVSSGPCGYEFEEIEWYSNINMEDDLSVIDISKEQELIEYVSKEE